MLFLISWNYSPLHLFNKSLLNTIFLFFLNCKTPFCKTIFATQNLLIIMLPLLSNSFLADNFVLTKRYAYLAFGLAYYRQAKFSVPVIWLFILFLMPLFYTFFSNFVAVFSIVVWQLWPCPFIFREFAVRMK